MASAAKLTSAVVGNGSAAAAPTQWLRSSSLNALSQFACFVATAAEAAAEPGCIDAVPGCAGALFTLQDLVAAGDRGLVLHLRVLICRTLLK